MDAEFILVSNDTKNSINFPKGTQELADKSQYFQRVLKMGNFGKSAKGGPFAKLSILAIFLAQLR